MAKGSIARHYVIEYLVPVSDSARQMVVKTNKPLVTLAKFKGVNPKAKVLRMFDKHTSEPVSIGVLGE